MESDLVQRLEPLHRDAYAWARHCCGAAPIDPGDVLQIAYLKILSGKARPRDSATLKSWWFGVIRWTAREEARRLRFRESLPMRMLRFAPAKETFALAPVIEADESLRALKAALLKLPTRQAEVLHLVFHQDLSIADASQVMGVSLGSARTHYERAKKKLRELLTP